MNPAENAKSKEIEKNLRETMDARSWAKEFMKVIANMPPDEGLMVGWFANAIMTGFDTANSRHRQALDEAEQRGRSQIKWPTEEEEIEYVGSGSKWAHQSHSLDYASGYGNGLAAALKWMRSFVEARK